MSLPIMVPNYLWGFLPTVPTWNVGPGFSGLACLSLPKAGPLSSLSSKSLLSGPFLPAATPRRLTLLLSWLAGLRLASLESQHRALCINHIPELDLRGSPMQFHPRPGGTAPLT